MIVRASSKVEASAAKYRASRIALTQLAPYLGKEDDAWGTEFLVLTDKDITGLPMEGWGEGSRSLSWIWTMAEATATGDPDDQPRLTDGA
jgi:hypothetical protein